MNRRDRAGGRPDSLFGILERHHPLPAFAWCDEAPGFDLEAMRARLRQIDAISIEPEAIAELLEMRRRGFVASWPPVGMTDDKLLLHFRQAGKTIAKTVAAGDAMGVDLRPLFDELDEDDRG